MDIMVSKNRNGNYYNFFSAVKQDHCVMLYEMYKDYSTTSEGTVIKPTTVIPNQKGSVLMKKGNIYFIPAGQIIERYDPTKRYVNTSKFKLGPKKSWNK